MGFGLKKGECTRNFYLAEYAPLREASEPCREPRRSPGGKSASTESGRLPCWGIFLPVTQSFLVRGSRRRPRKGGRGGRESRTPAESLAGETFPMRGKARKKKEEELKKMASLTPENCCDCKLVVPANGYVPQCGHGEKGEQ